MANTTPVFDGGFVHTEADTEAFKNLIPERIIVSDEAHQALAESLGLSEQG